MTELTDEAVKLLLSAPVADFDEDGQLVQTLARALLEARADAQAAVALVVERADIDAALDAMEANMRADGQTPLYWREDLPPEDQDKLRACVRAGIAAALADKNGLDLAQALRAERDHWETVAIARYANRLKAEAERDRLAAELAASRAREAGLVEALVEQNELLRSAMQIAKREGVDGNVASTNWDAYYNRVAVSLKRHHDTVNQARAALASTPPDTAWGSRS
jgi:hypothetical protein